MVTTAAILDFGICLNFILNHLEVMRSTIVNISCQYKSFSNKRISWGKIKMAAMRKHFSALSLSVCLSVY